MYFGLYGNGWLDAAMVALLAGLFLTGGRRRQSSADRQHLSVPCEIAEGKDGDEVLHSAQQSEEAGYLPAEVVPARRQRCRPSGTRPAVPGSPWLGMISIRPFKSSYRHTAYGEQ